MRLIYFISEFWLFLLSKSALQCFLILRCNIKIIKRIKYPRFWWLKFSQLYFLDLLLATPPMKSLFNAISLNDVAEFGRNYKSNYYPLLATAMIVFNLVCNLQTSLKIKVSFSDINARALRGCGKRSPVTQVGRCLPAGNAIFQTRRAFVPATKWRGQSDGQARSPVRCK